MADRLGQSADRWDRWADHYDEVWAGLDTDLVADRLYGLAGNGKALELGAGTGRVALALAERGTSVVGIEASPRMAALMEKKAADRDLPVEVRHADMIYGAECEEYDLVYCVFNSLYELPTQDEQLECLANAARSLAAEGCLVLEMTVPTFGGTLGARQQLAIRGLTDTTLTLSATMNDPTRQLIRFQEIRFDESGFDLLPVFTRYIWPAELDLMARLVGLKEVERFGHWNGTPFESGSVRHITVYRREA